MARAKKVLRLTPVESLGKRPPVIRLESRETLERAKSLRQGVGDQEPARLHVPTRDEIEVRTHEAETGILGNNGPSARELLEDWENEASRFKSILWSILAMVGLGLAGYGIWSLSQTQDLTAVPDHSLEATRSTLGHEVIADREAAQVVERIEAATRRYFATTDPATLSSLSRQSERIAPLITRHYQRKSIPKNRVLRTLHLEPLTLGRSADFWAHTVELENQEIRKVIVESSGSGDPKIDWEAFVGYQPMKWDDFVSERPTGSTMDFRVYLEPDHFFSHEFADASRWNSFRLTAQGSEETLFGYVENGSSVLKELLRLLQESEKPKIAVTLRLSIPAGIESRRGVVIDKIASPSWIYVDPPDA
jgi:hypothetical protein